MLTFFSGLFSAIAAFPAILSFVEKMIAAASDALFALKAKQASEAFNKAVAQAKAEKNTCELERAYNPDKKCD